MFDPSQLTINSKNYQVLDRIGEGSFGKVYKAKQFPNNQIVAIKIQNKITESEKILVKQFLGRKFKNLVNIFDYEEQQNLIYIVMEYCRVSLYDQIQKKTISPKDARYVMKEIINGIYELHKLGLAHRDIKPENILIYELQDQGQTQEIYKICDFGTSKELDKLQTKQVGTPYYLAPEQLQNNEQQQLYSSSIDIWAFGSVMYELFTNTPLFNGVTVVQIYNNILNLDINQKIDNLKDLELKYKNLLKRMLQRNPNDRINIDQIKKEIEEKRSFSVDRKPQFINNNFQFAKKNLDLKTPVQINQSAIINTNYQMTNSNAPLQFQNQNQQNQFKILAPCSNIQNSQQIAKPPLKFNQNQFQIQQKFTQHRQNNSVSDKQ
ncbi:unnamed protein product [Paramecium sonneborni]|uniref:Protein kinase domain-containing protein n=1 Tax=Paramecium sonneborni TaxID=65129 RepID=A0A8S1KGF4_9CILI|nr:unnamed protein product [Paramecium sonneborni]